MFRFVSRRMLIVVPQILISPLLVFLLLDLVPGDPARILAGESPTPEQVAATAKALGLDKPLLVRYLDWLVGFVQGDFGVSLVTQEPVADLVFRRMEATLSLVAFAIVVAIVIGTVLGIASGAAPGSVLDRVVSFLASVFIAAPPFWVGLVLVSIFAVTWNLLPAFGFVPVSEGVLPWLRSIILPGIALAALPTAEIAMHMRSSLRRVMSESYVLTAWAKGASRPSVLFKHALRNAGVPVVTVFGFRVTELLTGALAIEIVFNFAGLGSMALDSVLSRNLTVLLAFIVLCSIFVIIVNLLVDISYVILNPKLRTS